LVSASALGLSAYGVVLVFARIEEVDEMVGLIRRRLGRG
jgi:hypothetical protein